jgi:hypothetical protein
VIAAARKANKFDYDAPYEGVKALGSLHLADPHGEAELHRGSTTSPTAA